MKFKKILYIIIVLCISFAMCMATVNKSISIADGQTINKGLSSVNGSIHIGENCKISGNCKTINGRIKVNKNCKVRSLKTINGRIKVNETTVVDGRISSINGAVICQKGVGVKEDISTINGTIHLSNTHVNEGLTTHNGSIYLSDKSLVKGDIVIKKSNRSSFFIFKPKRHRLKIKVLEGSVVEGDIINKDKYVDVTVIIDKQSKVKGKIINAKVIKD